MNVADLPAKFWMTRDTLEGVLSEDVDFWGTKPDANYAASGDVTYACSEHLGQIKISEAKKQYTGSPDTSREVVVVSNGKKAK